MGEGNTKYKYIDGDNSCDFAWWRTLPRPCIADNFLAVKQLNNHICASACVYKGTQHDEECAAAVRGCSSIV